MTLHEELEQAGTVIADLVESIRWWASQEDGIPAEVARAYVNGMCFLRWEFGTEMDMTAVSDALAAELQIMALENAEGKVA